MAVNDQPMSIPADIALQTAPLLLGNLFNCGLFGVLTVQVYIYYVSFPKDTWRLKAVVAFAYALEIVQVVLATRDTFRHYASGWGNLVVLNDNGLLWLTIPTLDGIISSFSQLVYAWRIHVLSKNRYASSVVATIAIVQGTFGIYDGAIASGIGHLSDLQKRINKITAIWLGGSALCDVIITCSMIFYLRRAKGRRGERSTSVITRLIKLTAETGFICAAFAIIDLCFFVILTGDNLHLLPAITLSKLYTNSLLVIFNSRVRIEGGRNSGEVDETISRFGTISTFRVHVASSVTMDVSQVQDVESQLKSVAENPIELTDVGTLVKSMHGER